MEKEEINECSWYLEQKPKSHSDLRALALFSITGWLLALSSTCTMTGDGSVQGLSSKKCSHPLFSDLAPPFL